MRAEQFPLTTSFRPNQLGVSFQDVRNSHGIATGLLKGVFNFCGSVVDEYGCFVAVDGLDGGQAPVLHFQNKQTPLRVHHHKVGVEPGRADWDVVPAKVVVFQLRLKQTGEAALAVSVEFAGGYAGDEGGHVGLGFCG